ncbi:MAG: MBL fold metallo-hydrolase, partial [Alphaproteobacteria bacterium]|nr:MBL fold metallo-hydrolase [Alphaproteobacteria bacterium]
MRVTVLGCGTSGGVPRIGNIWGVCDPAEPRNRRRRSSILVQSGSTNLIVDTAPDM